MTHRKGAVWTERMVLALILISLGATFYLALAIHHRARSLVKTEKPAHPTGPSVPVEPKPAPAAIVRRPDPPPPSPRPPEDPTGPILARIQKAIDRETAAAQEADRKAADMEKAARASIEESERWKRREILVQQQIAEISRKAEKLEQNVASLDAERDILARERDALKAALEKDAHRSGYAVLPYKGPNGTWQRPIVLECSGNTVKLQPNGQTFSLVDLSPLIHPKASPIILAIARELLHIQQSETPDGAPAVPYLVFLIRPDGIRAYYQARGRLEPLGIAFGYELIEQNLLVDIPNLDDVRTWDGTVPLEIAESKPPAHWPSAGNSPGQNDDEPPPIWPGSDRIQPRESAQSGTWPPTGEPGGREGSPGRTTGLAQGGGLDRGFGGGDGPPGLGPQPPELALSGGAGESGKPAGEGPEGFTWPGASGSVGGPSRGAVGPGTSGGFAGSNTAGGSGSGGLSPGGFPSGGPGAGIGNDPAGSQSGRLLARADRSGSGNLSPLGAGMGATRAGGSGAGGSGGDQLPPLEPIQSGPSALDTPRIGQRPAPGSPGTVGSGPAWQRSSPATAINGAGSGAAGDIAQPFRSLGGGTRPGMTGASDGQGPASIAGKGSSPGQDGTGAAPGQSGIGGGGTSDLAQQQDGTGGGAGASGSTPSSGAFGSGGVAPATSSAASGTMTGGLPPTGSGPTAGAPASNPGLPPPLLQALANAGISPPNLPSTGMPSTGGTGGEPVSLADASAAGSPSSASGGSTGSNSGSSSSRSSSSSASGGQSSSSSTPSGMSLPSLDTRPDPSSEPDELKDLAAPPIDIHRKPNAIDVPFDIVVVCRRNDLLLHPGGFRITSQSLSGEAGKAEAGGPLLERELRAMVRRRAQVDPLIRPKPRVRFLVEAGGSPTFWKARSQLTFTNLDWPMSVQVAGPQTGYLLDERILR